HAAPPERGAVHRRRLALLDPRARRQDPSGAAHDRSDARPSGRADLRRDVLLAVARPRTPDVRAGAVGAAFGSVRSGGLIENAPLLTFEFVLAEPALLP